jgi:hypothetical protein
MGYSEQLALLGELKICHLLDLIHIEEKVGKAIIKQLYREKDNNFMEACEALERHPNV